MKNLNILRLTPFCPSVDVGADFDGDKDVEFTRQFNRETQFFSKDSGTVTRPRFDCMPPAAGEDPLFFVWCNDDTDGEKEDQEVSRHKDGGIPGIANTRDLEDLHLFGIKIIGGDKASDDFASGDFELYLEVSDSVAASSLTRLYRNINIYPSVSSSGRREDLTDEGVALEQLEYAMESVQPTPNILVWNSSGGGAMRVKVPKEWFLDNKKGSDLYCYFLMEAPEAQRLDIGAYVVFAPQKQNKGESGRLPVVFKPTKNFLEAWQSRFNENGGNISQMHANPATYVDGYQTLPMPTEDDDKKFVLFVHGVDTVPLWDKEGMMNTTFKRLYHNGYRGRAGGFFWDCEPSHLPLGQMNYDYSDFKAWKSAIELKNVLGQLKQRGYKVYLLAFSQGNVVATEALRLWLAEGNTTPLVEAYIAMQAAIPASIYTATAQTSIGNTSGTPDVYRHYFDGTLGPPYLHATVAGAGFRGAAQKWINFYNLADFALNDELFHWRWDQRTKPNSTCTTKGMASLGLTYVYSPETGPSRHITGRALKDGMYSDTRTISGISFEADKYEIFSFVMGSHAVPLGVVKMESSTFDESIELGSEMKFTGQQDDHGGQFRWAMYTKKGFWNTLFEKIQ